MFSTCVFMAVTSGCQNCDKLALGANLGQIRVRTSYIPLWTIDVPGRHVRVIFFLFNWFSITNNVEDMGPLQKISSYFGPIMAVIPTVLVHLVLVNHPYISRTSCQTSMTSQDVNCFDQWYCPGVGNRRCDWLMKLPQWSPIFVKKKSQRSLLARKAKQVCCCCCAQCEIKKRLIFTLFDNFAKKKNFPYNM